MGAQSRHDSWFLSLWLLVFNLQQSLLLEKFSMNNKSFSKIKIKKTQKFKISYTKVMDPFALMNILTSKVPILWWLVKLLQF